MKGATTTHYCCRRNDHDNSHCKGGCTDHIKRRDQPASMSFALRVASVSWQSQHILPSRWPAMASISPDSLSITFVGTQIGAQVLQQCLRTSAPILGSWQHTCLNTCLHERLSCTHVYTSLHTSLHIRAHVSTHISTHGSGVPPRRSSCRLLHASSAIPS